MFSDALKRTDGLDSSPGFEAWYTTWLHDIRVDLALDIMILLRVAPSALSR